MQTKIRRSLFIGLLIAFSISLVSFTINSGGDSFEIYLNKKLLMKQFQYDQQGTKTIELKLTDNDKQLDIRYSHCGVTGKSRSVTIKDGQNKILKTWNYTDGNIEMSLPVKEIPGRIKSRNNSVQLYYSSKEIPAGKLLAAIVFN